VTGLVAAGAVAKGAVSLLAMLAAQGTVLALIVWILVRALRLGPALGAALWLVVLAKFALPGGPAMPWSFSDLVASLRHDEVAAAITLPPIGGAAEAAGPVGPALGWLTLAAVWAGGTLVVLGRALRASRATLAQARAAQPAPDAALTLLAMLAASVKVRAPRLAIGDAATGPYVVGLRRPIIVIPPSLVDDPALLRAALLHELAHVRRKDAIGRFVQIWATAMFFWWPVVRMIGRRLDLAREAACDAWALETSPVSRPAYARLLVKMAGLRAVAAPALASPRTLDARVAAVLGPPVRARVGIVGKVVVAAWAVMALGGARSAAARGDKEVCVFTPQLAEALRQAHPEADLDGDGTLSKDEACEFQAEVRRRFEDQVSTLDDESAAELDRLIEQPLCCNCGGDGLTPASGDASCTEKPPQ
jgi:beta-lactamase regulating signal transducer with metallopeptidase domain